MDAHVAREPVDRELRRRQLAQRLVAHRARTQTIIRFTGLSRHQLTTLRQRWRIPSKTRRRGPHPRSFAVFLSTQRMRAEAAALAVLWRILASAGGRSGAREQTSMIEVGECICDVYEAYLGCFPKSRLKIEHLALLAHGIDEADAVALSQCGSCEAVILADLLGKRRRLCAHCQRSSTAIAAKDDSDNGDGGPPLGGEGCQGELF